MTTGEAPLWPDFFQAQTPEDRAHVLLDRHEAPVVTEGGGAGPDDGQDDLGRGPGQVARMALAKLRSP
jgi:hypothetical protein